MKRTFSGEVTVNWELVIADDSWATPEFFEEFAKTFYRFDNIQDYAEWVALNFARGSAGDFLEGAGPVDTLRNQLAILDNDGELVSEAKYTDYEWRVFIDRHGEGE